MTRTAVKLYYISFTLDNAFSYKAMMVRDLEYIAIYDDEFTQAQIVIGIVGPATGNDLDMLMPTGFGTETVGDKEVLTFHMPESVKYALGIYGDFDVFVIREGDAGLLIFASSNEKYITETRKIIESINVRWSTQPFK